jgi:FkbH-like protein
MLKQTLTSLFAPTPALTVEDVKLAYKLILGRDAESESVVNAKLSLGSVPALHKVLLQSREFTNRCAGGAPAAGKSPAPGTKPIAGVPEIPRLLGPRSRNLKLLLLGTCQLEPLVEAGARAGLTVNHMLMHSHAHTAVPVVATDGLDAIVVGLTLRNILDAAAKGIPGVCGDTLIARVTGDALQSDALIERAGEALAHKLSQLNPAFKGTPAFFMTFLEPSFNYTGTLLDPFEPSSLKQIIRRLNAKLGQLVKEFTNFHLLDTNEIANSVGRMHLQDDAIWVSAHASVIGDYDFGIDRKRVVPPKPIYDTYQAPAHIGLFGDALCTALVDSLTVLSGADRVKLVIVDLDDTLWRGVAAEENDFGPKGQTEGWPLGFVEALLYFKKRGGLLAICSKNDAIPTLGRLAKIWHNVLSVEDFVSIKINWDAKSKNIAAILAETNLLASSAVFIDDNPREIEEVRSVFPDLRCLSADHMDWRRILLRSPQTQVAVITAESSDRTHLVKARVEREAQSHAMPRSEFLESLHIEQRFLAVRSVKDPGFERGFELLNKTNQFNTTGIRWTLLEMEQFFQEKGIFLLTSLKDKTVDNGIIGATLIQAGTLVQTVLSCRVFGLGAEAALGQVATRIALSQAGEARGHVFDTGKNFTCHQYFADLGYHAQGDGYATHKPAALPAWITVAEDEIDALLARVEPGPARAAA